MTRTATRQKITASRAMKDEAAKRQLTDLLHMLRSKIEGNPPLYGGLLSKLDRAEASVLDGHIIQARDRIIEIERILDEKDEAARTQAQQAEQERLAEARNQPTVKADSGVSTRDGWLWLVGKGRYTPGRVESGRLFREKYAKAQDSLKSCIGDTSLGGGPADPSAGRHAKFEIDGVRRHMISSVGAASGGALFELLAAVVGRGETVRQLANGDDRKNDAKIIELGLALDLTGVYFGAVRT